MPVTRASYLHPALESISHQRRLPDEVVMLVHSGNVQEDECIEEEIEQFSERLSQETGATCITVLRSAIRLATSEACGILLDACQSDYATLMADDDGLQRDFLALVAEELHGRTEPVVLTGRLVDLEDQSKTVLDSGHIASSSQLANRLLSVVSGLIPGGSTVFPASLARQWRVFSSPVPIVTEDQLLSTRLFRHRLSWVFVPGAIYLYRQHVGQTGGGSAAEWYGVGVCRYVRLSEESHRFTRFLALLGFARELQRAGRSGSSLYRGFLDAGGMRSDARRALIMPPSLLPAAQRIRFGAIRLIRMARHQPGRP